MTVKEIRLALERKKGQRDQIKSSIVNIEDEIKSLDKDYKRAQEAQLIIQEVARQTQSELEYSISSIVTFALESVLDDPYKFKIEFSPKRGKTECDLKFVTKDGYEVDAPLDESGFGAIDVAATALRFSLWSLRKDKYRNLFLLDEPGKHLKGNDMPKKYGEMLRTISARLGIQIIVVSHTDDIIETADKVFSVSKDKNRISKVTVVR